MARFTVKDLKGVIPALVTCFDEKGAFDEIRQRAVVRFLLEKGVHGLYLTGSTGEGFLMSSEERNRVVDVVIDEVQGRVPIIVHVGAIGTALSIALAKHAEKAGADAISSVPPFYWKFSEDQMFNYYKDVTESVSIPMIVYNIALAGAVGFSFIKRLAGIDGVKGIKYTLTSQFEIMRIKEEIGHSFIVFSGCDEQAVAGLSLGADGIIGSFYNMIPEPFLDLYDAMQKKDIMRAQECQRVANAVIMFTLERGFIVGIKAGMKWMGIDAGFCREPFGSHSPELDEKYRSEFGGMKATLAAPAGIRFLDML